LFQKTIDLVEVFYYIAAMGSKRSFEFSNHALMKRINRAKVLNAIRLHSPVSRSEIAGFVALDKKSITNFVDELGREKLVEDIGKKQTQRGRPFTLLSFHRQQNLAMGLNIDAGVVAGVLLNLYGEKVNERQAFFSADGPLKDILAAVREVYEGLHPKGRNLIGSVGVSVPGIFDRQSGVMIGTVNIPALNGRNLRSELGNIIREPLALEEASQAKALAEKWFGLGKSERSFVCIDLSVGVGAGMIQDGRLNRGSGGYAGEIGHICIEPNGRLCRCGNRGCLETYISERAVLNEINAADIAQIDPKSAAGGILKLAGYRLGIGLSYLVNLLCPTLIVLNGNLMRFHTLLTPEIERGVKQQSLAACAAQTKIVPSQLQDASALGAASLVLSEVFEVHGHYYV
jgi:predicted NBD/HSP70 family sugar kinase